MSGIKHRSITQDLRFNSTKKTVDSLYVVYSKYVENKFVYRYNNQLYYVISISKKIAKKAVERNKIRRYIRQKINVLNKKLNFVSSCDQKLDKKLDQYCKNHDNKQHNCQHKEGSVLQKVLEKPLFFQIVILNKDIKSYIDDLYDSIINSVYITK